MSGTILPRGEVTVTFPDSGAELSDADVGLAPAAELSDADVGLAPAGPAPETAGQAALRVPGRAARMALQGVLQVPDMLNNAGAAVLNAPFVAYDAIRGNAPGTSEPFRYGAIADAGRRVADEAGLPQYPDSAVGRVTGLIGEGMAGGAGVAPLARQAARTLAGVPQQVARAFGDAPGVDMIAGGAGGAAQGLAAEAGVGQAGQAGANLGGNLGAAVMASIVAAVARRRAMAPPDSIRPSPDAVTPEEIAGVADEVAEAYRAQGIGDAEIRQAIEAFQLAEAQRSRVAAGVRDTQPATEPVPEQMSPRLRQDFAERAVSPRDPELPRLPDEEVVQAPPQTFRSESLDTPPVLGEDARLYGSRGDPGPEYDLRRAEMERAQIEADSAAVRARQAEADRLQALGYETNRARFQDQLAQEVPRGPAEAVPAAPVARPVAGGGAPDVGVPAGRGSAPDSVARPAAGAPGDAGPVGGGVPRADVAGAGSRAAAQIARLTRNGEPAPGTPAARQLARLRAQQSTPGEPSARTAPLSDRPAGPAEAPTTTRPPSETVAPQVGVPDARYAVAPAARPADAGPPANRGRANAAASRGVDGTSPPRGGPAAVSSPPAAAPEPGGAPRGAAASEPPARVGTAAQEQPPAGSGRRDAPEAGSPAAGREATTTERPPARNVAVDPVLRRAEAAEDLASAAERRARRLTRRGDTEGAAAARREADEADAEAQRLYAEYNAGREAPTEAPPLAAGLPLTPANVRRFVTDPAMAAARSVRDALMSSTAATRALRAAIHSKRAGMDWLARQYPNIPEVRQMRDMLATDPGEGRKIGETYQTAFESQHARMANRLRNIVGKDAGETEWAALRDQLTGKKGMTETARRVRALLDEQHDYLKAAGLDLGYVKGRYFPRRYDVDKILADPDSFRADAEKFYRSRLGLSADEAAEAAGDWLARVSGVGPLYGHTPISAKHTKGRVLPPEADTDLARWLDTDTRNALDGYFRTTSRLAEFTRRFGPNGKKADEMFRAMLDAGMKPDDLALMRDFFQGSTGTLNSVGKGPLLAAADWIQTAGTAALLSKAVLSSLVESFAVAARTGDALLGAKAFADTWKLVFNSDSLPDARRAAELIGAVNSSLADSAAATAVGVQDIRGKLPQQITNSIFRRTGLSGLTERQQIAATRAGQTWVGSLLDDVLDGTKRQASAKRLLAELGMDEKEARAVGAWLRRNDGVPSTEMLIDGGKEGALYRAALARFVRESVQNAQMVDKPLYAEHPVGRLAYGITSFMFAFSRNVVLRSFKEGGAALTEKGLTLEDRARLFGPVFGLTTLALAQFGIGWVRDNLLNPQQAAERDPWTKAILAIDRTGMFGTASPLVNQITSAKYQRSATSLLTGPYLSFYLDSIQKMSTALTPQPMGPNSPNTNNAEHAAARSAYRAFLAPAVTMGLAAAPGGQAVALAAGIGMVGVGMPAASWMFADATVGERTVKPRQPGGGRGLSAGGGIRAGGGLSAGGGISR